MTILEVLDAVYTKTISQLPTNANTRKLMGVSRETMEEALKSLKVGPKILARRSKTMCDILLITEQEARQLTGSIFTAKTVRFQTKYMGTERQG